MFSQIRNNVLSLSHRALISDLKYSIYGFPTRNFLIQIKRKNLDYPIKENFIFPRRYFRTDILVCQMSSSNNYHKNKSVSNKLMELSTSVDKIAYELMSEMKSKKRIYKNDFLRFFDKICELNFATTQHVTILLNCCTTMMPEVTQFERMEYLDKIWKKLSSFYTFNINNYIDLLKCYKENKHKFKANVFLERMLPILPNNTLYYSLIAAVCEVGDVNQAQEILQNMKVAKVPITVECCNSLIEAHGRVKDWNACNKILEMISAMRMTPTVDTEKSLIKAAIYSESLDHLETLLGSMKDKTFSETSGMEVIKCLAEKSLHKYIPKVIKLMSPEIWEECIIPPTINASCIHLIHQGHPQVAYDIYTKFPPVESDGATDENTYFRKLLRECVKASTPSEVIDHICSNLVIAKTNVYAYEIACEAGLQLLNMELVISLFKEMKNKDIPIRVHYFWPMFIYNAKIHGEKGIFDVISLMNSLEVTPDFDTFVEYILPNINMHSVQSVIKKFQVNGLHVSKTLSPVLYATLKENKLRDASELCELYPVKIDCQSLYFPLVHAFHNVQDFDSLFIILDAFIENPITNKKDWIGLFLVTFLSARKYTTDFENLDKILKYLIGKKVFLSRVAIDICMTLVNNSKLNAQEKLKTADILGTMVNKDEYEEVDLFEQFIKHPKDMNLKQLEAHLIELESKNMNTRGILRKLLQEYCRFGMVKEAMVILKKCENLQVNFSAGMLASVIDLYVKCEDFENAEKHFYNLKKVAPNFHLDEFKLLDFVTLLVLHGKFADGMEILEDFGRKVQIQGGNKIENNCWKLLNAVAKYKDPKQTEKLFTTICRLGFCKPSNVLLGPLIKCYLSNSDVFGAVEKFEYISKTYKKTPYKHELLCRTIMISTGNTPDSQEKVGGETKQEISKRCVKTIINCDKSVHGNVASQVSLILALADCGLKKQLRKYVLEPSISVDQNSLIKQCERLGDENKVEAIETIAECIHGLRNINVAKMYDILINVHNVNGDCDSALALWNRMQEYNVKPSEKFVLVFSGMLKSHKYDLPHDLIGYLDAKSREHILNQ